MTAGGTEAYTKPTDKAAAIAESIVRNHPFNDGNHRSALAAAHLVLGLYELRLVASQNEQEDAIRNLGSGTVTLDQFAVWLEQNVILRTAPQS